MLRELRHNPHRSIVPFLGTWKDSGVRYNIIFPLANMDLRQMTELEPPQMDRSFVNNLQVQLHGLANGIEHIHNFTLGRHGDLKPDNILVFTEHGKHVWKIADLGLVRLKDRDSDTNATVSHTTSRGGTTAYLPPER